MERHCRYKVPKELVAAGVRVGGGGKTTGKPKNAIKYYSRIPGKQLRLNKCSLKE